MADGWPGSNLRFWSNPFLIVPYATIITGTIFVLTFHILLISFSRSLYLLSFSVSFVLTFQSSGMAISIIRQVFSFLSCSTISCRFASIFRSVETGAAHITVVSLAFVTLSCIPFMFIALVTNLFYYYYYYYYFLVVVAAAAAVFGYCWPSCAYQVYSRAYELRFAN